MIIAINITPAMRQTTGIGTYSKEFISALLKYDQENRYTLLFSKGYFSKKRLNENFLKDNKRVVFKSVNLPYKFLNFLWNDLNLFPVDYLCAECDIFHSLDILSPLANKAKVITTVHDISWLIFDDKTMPDKRRLYKQASRSLQRSRVIIADSNFTKKEILKYFSFLTEDKIKVVYLGVSETFRPLDKLFLEDMKKKYGWGDFILYIGALDKDRKNLGRLIEAYSILKRKKQIKEKLVLCGKKSKYSKELLNLVEKFNLSKDIIVFNKWIFEDNIPILYNMAKLLVYPSLYEGFGLPILEAMACGTPVITSRISSMPEVGGDACLYINPYDVDNLADEMQKVITDATLCEKLSRQGLEHAKKFTWQNTACTTLNIYKEALT